MNTIAANIRAYESSLDELREQHGDATVVFHDEELFGVFDDFEAAAVASLKRFGRKDTFLIRGIDDQPSMRMPASVFLHP